MERTMTIIALVWLIAVCGFSTTSAEESSLKAHSLDDGLVRTPPMGWYPWNQFGQEPQNEQLIKEIADALVNSGMHDVGYSFVGPDEGICFSRDSNNELVTNQKRYPSGLRGIGDYIHKKGLKYALYTDAGTLTCSNAMPGTKGYEFEDMKQFAKWRCDYVKIDWCNTDGQDIIKTYTKLHDAQHAAGRPIVHSLCSWGEGEPWKWAASVGHLWRTTGDICGPGRADWELAVTIAFENEKLYKWAGPGYWNDPDMLVVGMDGLSESQNRSLFSLWCMMASPLIAGNDLRNMSASTIQILTNIEAIGVNQDPLGIQGHIVRSAGNVSIWAGKPLYDGSQAVLVFNQQSSPADVRIEWSDIGIDKKDALYVRNLWTHKTSGPHTDGISVPVNANDVVMLRISKTNKFPLPPIIVADSYLVSLRATDTTAQSLSATITISNKGSDDLPLWKVHKELPGWLTVTVSKNGNKQTLTNTISTSGLKKGLYHAIVRADNTEPVSGKPISAVYYDVELEVSGTK